MKSVVLAASVAALSLAGVAGLAPAAQAKGCVKGAVVGGVGGHFVGHHPIAGAAVGCAVGHHMAHKQAVQARRAQTAPVRR